MPADASPLDPARAEALERADPVRSRRAEFCLPPWPGGAHPEWAYFAGNSLGLMPRVAREAVAGELDEWPAWRWRGGSRPAPRRRRDDAPHRRRRGGDRAGGPDARRHHDDVVEAIERAGPTLAATLLAAVNYLPGELLDVHAITDAARRAGAIAGWDLAHAVATSRSRSTTPAPTSPSGATTST